MQETSLYPARTTKKKIPYEYLFKPQSIAVVGASDNPLKPGGRVIKNIKEHQYKGRLWAVNPKSSSILDLPTFPDIAALPHGPDLAIVAIPSSFVLPAIEALAVKGTGAVLVLTSGFGEKDEEGKAIERQMLDIALEAEMTLIGPNCSGFLTRTYKGKFAGIIPTLKGAAVDFISGSGATVDFVMEQATNRGLSFNNVVNLGNSVQVGVEDMLAMYDANYGADSAKVLMLYMESVKKPALLLRHAQSLIKKGCAIVGIKSGVTAAGKRAAASHTGAMATSDTAVQALFEKAGIIRVKSKIELINVACVLAVSRGRLRGRKACIITDAGGPGVMLSDELNRQGWDLPVLSKTTQQKLSAILPPESAIGNPIDCLPSRNADQIRDILKVLAQEEKDNIDIIAIILGDSGMSDNSHIYREISMAMDDHPIPIVPVLASVTTSREKINSFKADGKIYFFDEVSLGTALGSISAAVSSEESVRSMKGYDKSAIAGLLDGTIGVLPPETVAAVMAAAGFNLPVQCEVEDKALLLEACRQVGFPLVMKVIGPLHKTDVGGVRLGLGDEQEANDAWDALLEIPDARGVLVQPMITGVEVILGASREGDFGHLIMFGLGGIHAEVLKDVKFALAPVSEGLSRHMIQGILGYPILEGVRGEPGMSIDMLSDYIQRLGLLITDFPQIQEMDLNPVKGKERDLYVVDARIIMV